MRRPRTTLGRSAAGIYIYSCNTIHPTSISHIFAYDYNNNVAVELLFLNDAQRYFGGRVAPGRFSHARRLGGEKPEKEATHRSSRIAGGWA